MRSIVVVAFVALLVASVVGSAEVFGPRGYHEEVGIPLARMLKAAEEQRIASMARLSDNDDRVVGGVIAPANSHPYLGGLLINFFNHWGQSVCGSSLVSANRLVTAAHCWFDGVNHGSMVTVVLGTQSLWTGDGQRIATSHVVMHPQWNPWNYSNDVAVIYLPYSITFSNSIQPISLPNSWELAESFVGEWAVAAGYGKTSDSQVGASPEVSHVSLQVITVQACRDVFGSNFIFDSTLCTSGTGFVGVCGGDSGGPLFVQRSGRRLLIGISSFVAANNCQGGHPSAFARVTSFMNFIQQNLW